MAIKSFIKYWGIFCLLALNLFVGGCSDGETLPADQSESRFVDSLLVSMYDSMYVSPVSAEQTFRNAQKGISDSISYYKLELFAAFSGGLQGRIDEAMDVNDKVLAFCHAHAGSEALEAMCWNHRNALFLALGRRDSALVCLSNAYDASIVLTTNVRWNPYASILPTSIARKAMLPKPPCTITVLCA